MKKIVLSLSLIVSSLLSNPLFAESNIPSSAFGVVKNDCINQMDKHRKGVYLDLSQCHIGNAAVPQIISYLNKNPSIHFLSLENNSIGAEGANALAKNKTLEVLMLGHNEIGDAGLTALANNKKIVTLQVQDNKITDVGAIAFAAKSKANYIKMNNNNITAEGAKALIKNTNFIYLSLSKGMIDDKTANTLASEAHLNALDLTTSEAPKSGTYALSENNELLKH